MASRGRSPILTLHTLVFVVLVICSGTLLALSAGGFVLDFKQIGFTVMSTGQRGVFAVYDGCVKTITSVKKLSALNKEYQILTEKLRNYEYLQRNNAEIRKENDMLREQLGFSKSLVNANIPARIIGRDSNAAYSAIVIDKGSRDGIKKNMPVVAVQSGSVGLVGKIITVGYTTSILMPVYDFQCNVSARIQSTRDVGIVSGSGSPDTPLVMKYIRKRVLDELQYGDIIVTSGENDNYLREIPVGTISKVSLFDYDSSLEIELMPAIDFLRLETVIAVDINSPADSEERK